MDISICEDQHMECCPDDHHGHPDGIMLEGHHGSIGGTMVSTSVPMVCDPKK